MIDLIQILKNFQQFVGGGGGVDAVQNGSKSKLAMISYNCSISIVFCQYLRHFAISELIAINENIFRPI